MTVVPTRAQALAGTLAAARARGLPTDDPVVLAEGYSLRVWLRPAPVVTRYVTAGLLLRGDPLPWLAREVAVAGWLAARGAPVVAPWDDPGPYDAVTFWHHAPAVADVDDAAFGPLLGELHTVLADYPDPLPVLVGPLTDVAAARRLSADPVLHAAADLLVPLARAMPRRPLHGDAHTGNLLGTAAGPRWIDLEDVCAGPVEWDLASRTVTDAMVAAYPGEVDPERLAVLRDLRRLQSLAGLLTDDVQDAAATPLVAALERRLATD